MGGMQKCRPVHVREECRNADLCMGQRALFPHRLKEVGSADYGAGAHNGRLPQEPPNEEVLGRKGRLVRAARDEARQFPPQLPLPWGSGNLILQMPLLGHMTFVSTQLHGVN